MAFLTPVYLLFGLLALPIILLYMLRLRRREVLVSSTLLWQKLMRDREANAPWQKLRRNLLLFLQLLILAALVFALARPFLPVPSIATGNVVVLLDASASMLATDVEPTRFDAAKEEINRLIGELGSNSQMTIIKVGQTPAVLIAATNDKAALREAIANITAEPTAADWTAAFALATGAAQGFSNARVVIISDGGLPADLPPLPAETAYIPIGTSGENLAISALATRNTIDGPQLFASIRNEGLLDKEALLSVSLDGTLFDSRRIVVPAQNTTNVTWNLPEGTAVIEARLSNQTDDFLPVDDIAWAVHEGGITNRALLVTEGNLFLEQVYAILPGIDAFKSSPENDLTTEQFDLYIFDSVSLPDPPPDADMLIINPQPDSNPLFTISGTFSDTVTIRLADSPLLQFVDWSNVHIRAAKQIAAPWADVLVEAQGGPLILAGEQAGRRIVIMTFDLRDSDLPLQIAFPILIANITNWLSPGKAFDVPAGLQPGEPVTIVPTASTTAVLVQKPDDTIWESEAEAQSLLFTETNLPGVYQVILRDNTGEQPAGRFAVNLFNASESHILPADSLQIGQTEVETEPEGNIGQREFWPWLAALAFGLLIVEWWVYHRGTKLPDFKLR
ncbi:MAG: VWA domain-containing protein [Chloroflexi bacterium]|nr:MAG: VWA domain-containing protein [Chloroflexota bacterium]